MHVRRLTCQVLLVGVSILMLANPILAVDVCLDPFDGTDTDLDGVENACDCAPGDGTAFWIPPQVENLGFLPLNADTIQWDAIPLAAAGTGVTYDVLKGVVSDLLAGITSTEICLADDQAALTSTDSTTPPAGEIWFYLVRGNHACGAGPFTRDRSHTVCPSPFGSPPPPVTGLKTSISGTDVILAWNPVPSATDYAIYRIGPGAPVDDNGDCLASGIAIVGTTYTDVGAMSGPGTPSVSYIVVSRDATGVESLLGSNGAGRQLFRQNAPCP